MWRHHINIPLPVTVTSFCHCCDFILTVIVVKFCNCDSHHCQQSNPGIYCSTSSILLLIYNRAQATSDSTCISTLQHIRRPNSLVIACSQLTIQITSNKVIPYLHSAVPCRVLLDIEVLSFAFEA